MFFARATQLGYFGNKKYKEGDIFVIRPKKYFCKVDKVEKTMTAKDQFSNKWMEEVKQSQSKGQSTNTNWEDSEKDRIAMADATAQAEIDANTDARVKQEAEDAAAVQAVKDGADPAKVDSSEDTSTEGDTPNEEEEVI